MGDSATPIFDVLHIEDDEDDYVLTRKLLEEIQGVRYRLTWTASYHQGLASVRLMDHHACLLDIQLGSEDGLELLREIRTVAPRLPVIMLTGHSDRDVDLAAMEAGADDYLSKGDLSSTLLDRSIRYAIERRREAEERRTMEAQLANMKHLESIADLAGGVAHEINNILTVVQAESTLLQADNASGDVDSVDERAGAIRKAARTGGAFVAELVGYGRKRRLDPQRLDLSAKLRRLDPVLRNLLPDGATLDTIARGDIDIVADPLSIDILARNITETAAAAMTANDLLRITLGLTRAEEEPLLQRFSLEGDYVLLSFEYTGRTMTSDEVSRVFKPHFSNGEMEGGTGLGMAMVYGLVKQHKGHIDLQSEPGGANTVRVWLPQGATHTHRHRPTHSSNGELRGGTETVLVVDDELRLLRAAAQLLRRLGYTVLEAVNGVDALAVFQQHQNEIDLILTDVVMPEADGMELFTSVRQWDPAPKFLFMSGYSATQLSNDGLLRAGFPLLEKPWELDELACRVRGVLDDHQQLPTPHLPKGRRPSQPVQASPPSRSTSASFTTGQRS